MREKKKKKEANNFRLEVISFVPMGRRDRDAFQAKQESLKNKAKRKKKKEAPKASMGLEWLLGGSSGAFLREKFEKEPLHVSRGDPHYYEQVFGTAHIRDMLERKQQLGLRRDLNICRVEEGRRVDLPHALGELSPDEVWAAHASGYTLQVFQPQQQCLGLAELMSALEDTFGSLCGANSYLTPPGSQGLAPHYDDVEVFILQIEGRKRWRLYYPTVELPEEYSPDFAPEEVPGLKFHSEVLVEQGDLLYFPRGWIHQAVTSDDVGSHHVTLSTYQKHSVKELLKVAFENALEAASQEGDLGKALRSGLPWAVGVNFGSSAPEHPQQDAFDDKVAEMMSAVLNELDVSAAVDRMQAEFIKNRLPPAEDIRASGEERFEKEQHLLDLVAEQIMEEQEDEDEDDLGPEGEFFGDNEPDDLGHHGDDEDIQEDEDEDEDEDEEDEVQVRDAEGNIFGSNPFAFPPGRLDVDHYKNLDEDDDDDDDNDDDDDDDMEGAVAALSEPGTRVKMVSGSHVVWSLWPDDEGELSLVGVHSLNNLVTSHMNASAVEVQNYIANRVELPASFEPAVHHLMKQSDFIDVDEVPVADAEERIHFLASLLTSGLITIDHQ